MDKTDQRKSNQTALKLFTKFGQVNFRGVEKHCFDLSPLTSPRSFPTSLNCLPLLPAS